MFLMLKKKCNLEVGLNVWNYICKKNCQHINFFNTKTDKKNLYLLLQIKIE